MSNILLVKSDAGLPVRFLMAFHSFVRELLSSALWQLITGWAIRLSPTQIHLFSGLSTCFIYKSWLFLLKVRLFLASGLNVERWLSSCITGGKEFLHSCIHFCSYLGGKQGDWSHFQGACVEMDAVLINLPCTHKEPFSFRLIHQTDGLMCEVNWLSFYRRVLIYSNPV